MADYSDPKRATAYRFTLSLFARSDNQIKTAPTLAAGDVKVSKDNGATANITTLPAETPASSGILQVDLSATEMTADLVTVIFRDAAGAEWNDVAVHIAPAVRQMADLAYPATSGRSMVVDAAGLVDANMVKAGASGAGNTITTSGGVTLPAATLASTTNITAGTVTTATNVTTVNGLAAGVITATSIAADAITDAKVASDVTIASVTGAVGSVTGNVGGNVVGSVASVTAGVTLAASAVQAIWDALTTALTTVGSIGKLLVDNVNATVSSRLASASYTAPLDAAGTRTAVGLTSANLDTQLDALPTNAELATAIPTADITAIKAKTDSLTFTVAGQVDANLQYVNDVLVTGNGQSGTEWGP